MSDSISSPMCARARRGACFVLCAALPLPATAQVRRVPSGFAVEPVVLEPFVSDPVGFAFLPEGRVVLIEKDSGNVRLAARDASSSVVIATVPGVAIGPERGLLGVAVDPGWPARPYLYFHSTQTDTTIQIAMYTAAGDLSDPSSTSLTLGNPYVILKAIPNLFTNHNAGTVRFGPDGYLYVSVGDNSRSCDAQDLGMPLGKILRLDVALMPGPGGGPPPLADITPAGNPFPGPTPITRLVYAYGLRNPFRFTIDPRTNNLYIGDVGFGTWEEEDELEYAGYTGTNYGWPEFEGPLQDPHGPSSNCSTPPFVPPIYYYLNPPGPPVVAIIGGPLYRGDPEGAYSFPRAYDGDLFVCEFYEKWIRRLKRSGGGWTLADSVAGQPTSTNWAANMGNIADIQTGPDGAIWFLNMITNAGLFRGLYRIVNTLPSDAGDWAGGVAVRARIVPNPAFAARGATIRFQLARPEAVLVRIYDPAGRLVRTLRPPDPGRSGSILWDGRTGQGQAARPGLYLYEVRSASGDKAQGKIALLR